MIMSWFRALIILIRLGPFITTNGNELAMFANQPLRNGHPTLHIAITPNAPLDAVKLLPVNQIPKVLFILNVAKKWKQTPAIPGFTENEVVVKPLKKT